MFQVDYFFELIIKIFPYMRVTLKLAFLSLILAFTLALVLAVIRHYKIFMLDGFCKVYISFFRSTPFISQLFLFYFGLAQVVPFIRDMSGEVAVILALAANSSAYMCESIRGALLSVDKGQIEAGLAMGMTNLQIMRRVILPQAMRVAIPPLSNNFISLTKSTSMGFTVGIVEMMGKSKLEAANSFRFIESYAAVLCVYWVMISAMSLVQGKVEKRLNESY